MKILDYNPHESSMKDMEHKIQRAGQDCEHKINRLKQYREKLCKLRDAMKRTSTDKTNTEHIHKILERYQHEYRDVHRYMEYTARPVYRYLLLIHDKAQAQSITINDTINTMSGSINRVKDEYEHSKRAYQKEQQKKDEELIDDKCTCGFVWDVIVAIPLIILFILNLLNDHHTRIALALSTISLIIWLLSSFTLFILADINYYHHEYRKLSLGQSLFSVRLLNVITFFALVICILNSQAIWEAI